MFPNEGSWKKNRVMYLRMFWLVSFKLLLTSFESEGTCLFTYNSSIGLQVLSPSHVHLICYGIACYFIVVQL